LTGNNKTLFEKYSKAVTDANAAKAAVDVKVQTANAGKVAKEKAVAAAALKKTREEKEVTRGEAEQKLKVDQADFKARKDGAQKELDTLVSKYQSSGSLSQAKKDEILGKLFDQKVLVNNFAADYNKKTTELTALQAKHEQERAGEKQVDADAKAKEDKEAKEAAGAKKVVDAYDASTKSKTKYDTKLADKKKELAAE
jgi:hypothetical protein